MQQTSEETLRELEDEIRDLNRRRSELSIQLANVTRERNRVLQHISQISRNRAEYDQEEK